MDLRKQMVLRVSEGQLGVSGAAREYRVTRKTVRKWVSRARDCGLEGLSEESRAPLRSPTKTDVGSERLLLELKDEFPDWGAKKLVLLAQRRHGLELCLRTADRILARNGRTVKRESTREPIRFERESPNMLYQMDFKGLPKSSPFALLSVLDDASRMSPLFEPIRDKTGEAVFERLWDMFAEFGLPESFLMDNGDCWGSSLRRCPTAFEAKLWRLGVRTAHGKPRHPQTQGKVERFHGTAKREMKVDLLSPNAQEVKAACARFRDRYNWVRPHEALGGQVPGSVFVPSPRKRPDRLPEPAAVWGAHTRKVDGQGDFSFKGRSYRIGKGLIGQPVQIADDELGLRTYYAGFPMAYLDQL